MNLPDNILASRLVLDSTNPAEVRTQVEQIFVRHSMRVAPSTPRLHALLWHKPLRNLSLSVVKYGCRVLVEPDPLSTFYLLHLNLAGVCEVAHGSHRLTVDKERAALLVPNRRYEVRWHESSKALAIQIPQTCMRSHARQFLGVELPEDTEFAPSLDLTTSSGQALLRFIRFLVDDAEHDCGVTANPMTAQFLERALIDTILRLQLPTYYPDPVRANSMALPQVLPSHVRKAKQYMMDNVEKPLRVPEVAAFVGISERSLSANFNHFLGIAPARYFLYMRLDRARSMLQNADPYLRVSDVVHELGFNHHSRFSAAYKERFAESPAETLWRNKRVVAPS
ncbi:MAG: AraC family transcriptional regulator [Pseudomonadota bacterium]